MQSNARPFCDLTGRRIFIAGAAGGIGGETAKLCATLGATLVLADIAPVQAIRERVGAAVAEAARIHSLDFSERSAVDALAAEVEPVFGLIDTTGVALFDDWMAPDFDDALERIVRANIKSPINLARAFFPGMIERREGRIVMCGSVAGWMGGIRTGPHYAFSKGGMHAFTRWLSRQGAPHNVLVNAIAPGPVETPMTAGQGYDPAQYPLRRMARPEEIASFAAFLCGPGAGYTTGAVFDVNGGTHFH